MPPWANPLQTWLLGAGRKGSEKVNSERNGPIRRLACRSVVKVFAPDAYREYDFIPDQNALTPMGWRVHAKRLVCCKEGMSGLPTSFPSEKNPIALRTSNRD